MDPPIAVILNSQSGDGNGDSTREKLEALFRASGAIARVTVASEDGLKQLVEKAARGECAIIAAGGGDGTIACVAAALVGTDKTLGVLPLGSLNHFSKDLGIPQELEEAVRVVVAGQSIQVDVGEVNGRVFLNNSSLGMYPLVVSDRLAQQHRLGRAKWLAFFWAVLRALWRYPLLQVRIRAEAQDMTRRTPSVFVGNNAYTYSGLDLGTRTTLQDGKLSLYVSRDVGRWGLLGLLLRALARRLHPKTDFDALSVEEASIETGHRNLLVATDGEVTPMTSPLHYRIRPAALRVRVPRPTGKN